MKVKLSPWFFAMACGVLFCAKGLVAQPDCTTLTCIQVFSAVDTRQSPSTATYAAPYTFNTSNLNLTCPDPAVTGQPIYAMLSGPLMKSDGTAPQLNASNALQPGGGLLVDNNLLVTVNSGTPTNVCTGGLDQGSSFEGQTVPPNLEQNCFTGGYGSASGWPIIPGPLNGQDPDTYQVSGQTVDYIGGVAPIDIHSLLSPGKQTVTVGPTDEGGILTASSIFLVTNCTQNGVTGPATVTGNTFTGDAGTLAQTFNFDTGQNQQVGFVYDVSKVNNAGNGTIPQTTDAPLDPSIFQPNHVKGTSFATSNCLIHDGELLADGITHACKLFTLACTDPVSGKTAGANCPVSVFENEVVKDLFDGPQFSLQNVYTPYGVFHEGIGFLMASDNWTPTAGGPCTFDQNADPVATLPCPQNLLTSFSGPGGFTGQGLTTNPNSTFISIAGVPQDATSIQVPSEWPDHWSNTHTPKVYFSTQAPNLSKGAYVLNSANKLVPLASAANYIPAPIRSITYGISPAGSPLPLPINEPIDGDVSLTPSQPLTTTCPTQLPTTKTEPNFTPAPVTLPSLPDGQYLLHYYAQDCAGTQELLFTLNPPNAQNQNLPYWSTSFYTRELNIDTTPPVVTTLTLPPPNGTAGAYKLNSNVSASFKCTDASSGAGVVQCGLNTFGTETTYTTNTLTARINTSSTGAKTFTVYAVDGAGNTASRSINYTVSK